MKRRQHPSYMKMSKFNVKSKENQHHLLEYLKVENLTAFTNLLQNRAIYNIDPDHVNGDPYYMTCLAIAAEKGLCEFMEALLKNGADPNLICRARRGNAAIHFAAEEAHLEAIDCLVQHKVDLSVVNKSGNTALNVVAQRLSDSYEKEIDYLVQHKVDLSVVNKNGNTALNDEAQRKSDRRSAAYEKCFLYLACLPGMNLHHRNLLGQSAISEVVRKCTNANAKDTMRKVLCCCDLRPEDKKLILETYPELKSDAPESREHEYTHDDAYTDLRNRDFKRFNEKFKEEFTNKTGLIGTTFLQLACEQGLLCVVKLLLKYNADINKCGKQESKPPIYLACYHGYCEILECLCAQSNINVDLWEKKTLLHTVLKGVVDRRAVPEMHYKCFNYLLKNIQILKIHINHRDNYGCTALHYAVQERDNYFAEALLEHGAYIGSLNDFGCCLLYHMDPETLETALNKCVECSIGNSAYEYSLKCNFNILRPTEVCDDNNRSKDVESGEIPQESLPEIFPLYFLSQSKKLGHLLTHPLLLIFLHLKWSQITLLFYINMIFYIIFVIFLTVYNMSCCNMYCECIHDSEPVLFRVTFVVLFVVLIFRELMQFCTLQEKFTYFRNLENWLEIGIIITTILILVGICSKIVAAINLLLAWTEVILQLSCIYSLAVYSEMMKTVALNYMKFLLWYSPLIIGFTFSFYKLNHFEDASKENGSPYLVQNMSNNFSTHDDDVDFYSNLHLSLLKTVVMMTGEFDASKMSLNHGGYFIFLFFIFIMTVILMNLMNGLAVSDTQAIKNNAELVTYRSKVKLIHRFESVVFEGSRIGRGGCGHKLTCQILSLWRPWQMRLQRKISLFPYVLPHSSLEIIFNQGVNYKDTAYNVEDVEFRPDTCFKIGKCRLGFHIDREVLEAAKNIAGRSAEESEGKNNQIVKRIAKIEEDIHGCKEKLNLLTVESETIRTKLNAINATLGLTR